MKAAGLNKWTGAVRGDREAESEEEEEKEEVEGGGGGGGGRGRRGINEGDEEAENEEADEDGGDVHSRPHEERSTPSAPPPEVLSLADASFDTGRRETRRSRVHHRWPDYVYRVLH